MMTGCISPTTQVDGANGTANIPEEQTHSHKSWKKLRTAVHVKAMTNSLLQEERSLHGVQHVERTETQYRCMLVSAHIPSCRAVQSSCVSTTTSLLSSLRRIADRKSVFCKKNVGGNPRKSNARSSIIIEVQFVYNNRHNDSPTRRLQPTASDRGGTCSRFSCLYMSLSWCRTRFVPTTYYKIVI